MEAILSIETSSTACAAVLGANQSTNQFTKSKKNIMHGETQNACIATRALQYVRYNMHTDPTCHDECVLTLLYTLYWRDLERQLMWKCQCMEFWI
eukprot:158253_1